MIYGSVCSGIEAATVAWHPLGWRPAWFSEIKAFPCRLLTHYYPHIPNLGDMLKIEENETFKESTIAVLVGGTPCQSFSLAGLRGGLADTRGNLALEFCRILTIKRPRWFVWENVPGVFSVKKGRAFQSILAGFRQCGYSLSWRTMDAQFFRVPQRRRRVFVVGCLGDDWRPSASVLFEPQGLRGNPAPGGITGQDITGTLTQRPSGGFGADEAAAGMLVFGGNDTRGPRDLAHTLMSGHSLRDDFESENFIVYDGAQITSKANQSNPQPGDPAPTVAADSRLWSIMPMNSGKDYTAREMQVTQPLTTQQGITDQGGDVVQTFQSSQSGVRLGEQSFTLTSQMGSRTRSGIINHSIVRRLTPTECERLQGFPDGYTAIPGAKDSPRYEALGNSMPVPVMRWIGKQIDLYDKIFFPNG